MSGTPDPGTKGESTFLAFSPSKRGQAGALAWDDEAPETHGPENPLGSCMPTDRSGERVSIPCSHGIQGDRRPAAGHPAGWGLAFQGLSDGQPDLPSEPAPHARPTPCFDRREALTRGLAMEQLASRLSARGRSRTGFGPSGTQRFSALRTEI